MATDINSIIDALRDNLLYLMKPYAFLNVVIQMEYIQRKDDPDRPTCIKGVHFPLDMSTETNV